jgi:GntR family transcriptional regulator, transcriptional repressor for pyruvate dehydrogenase complex
LALTDEAILKIRDLIQSDQLAPGSRLPPEQQLSAQLGLSRSGLREAMKALEVARVVDVRRGDGTYVTSLAPRLLLEGFGFAVDLLRDDSLPQIMEVRRLLEPSATGLAATRITDAELDELAELLARMREAADDAEQLIRYDSAFHHAVAAAARNESLTSLLDGLSGRTLRARLWRGMINGNVSGQTIAEHEAIYRSLRARDQLLAHSAALIHVDTSESWLQTLLSSANDELSE